MHKDCMQIAYQIILLASMLLLLDEHSPEVLHIPHNHTRVEPVRDREAGRAFIFL